jgi:hypothetical protein
MADTPDDAESELRKKLRQQMRRIRTHVRKEHAVIIEALLDVGEETRLDVLNSDQWSLKAWPCFIEALERRLKREQDVHADEVRSRLRVMRGDIGMA